MREGGMRLAAANILNADGAQSVEDKSGRRRPGDDRQSFVVTDGVRNAFAALQRFDL